MKSATLTRGQTRLKLFIDKFDMIFPIEECHYVKVSSLDGRLGSEG